MLDALMLVLSDDGAADSPVAGEEWLPSPAIACPSALEEACSIEDIEGDAIAAAEHTLACKVTWQYISTATADNLRNA